MKFSLIRFERKQKFHKGLRKQYFIKSFLMVDLGGDIDKLNRDTKKINNNIFANRNTIRFHNRHYIGDTIKNNMYDKTPPSHMSNYRSYNDKIKYRSRFIR